MLGNGRRIDLFYGSVPAAPDIEPITQGVEYVRGAVPVPPDLDTLTRQVELFYGIVPPAPDIDRIDQLIDLAYSGVPVLAGLDPITRLIELEYGGLPAVPDLGSDLAVPAVAGAAAAPLDPVINVYVDNLFADPQAEARKVGSQVYIREGFTVARESGFNG